MAGIWFALFETTYWNLAWHDFASVPKIFQWIFKLGIYANPLETRGWDILGIGIGIIYLILSALFFALFVQNVFNGIEKVK